MLIYCLACYVHICVYVSIIIMLSSVDILLQIYRYKYLFSYYYDHFHKCFYLYYVWYYGCSVQNKRQVRCNSDLFILLELRLILNDNN